jgi:hypothetical protein
MNPSVDRRNLLALTGTCLAATAVGARAAGLPASTSLLSPAELSVWSRATTDDPYTWFDRDVVRVAGSLGQANLGGLDEDAVELVEEHLQAAYPGQVGAPVLDPYYRLVWCGPGEGWKIVCFDSASFEIRFPTSSTVLVGVRLRRVM